MSSPYLLDPSLSPRRCWYVSSVKTKVKFTHEQAVKSQGGGGGAQV
jgi:hypothetical protein